MSTDAAQPSSYEPDESRAALQALLAENARALDAASDRHIADGYERLHELIVTLFAEKDRALSMAADEREKAAQVLREEQHRALGVAESEREKAASALREALSRSISEGDERLREHIANQVSQIQSALVASELLELERIRRCETTIKGTHDELIAMIDANTREFRQVQAATKQAVDKAEEAQLRVNASQNEFRASLSDQAATLMPRRESEAKHEGHTLAIRELRDELGKLRTDLAVGPAGLAPLTTNAARQAGRHESSQAITAALISVAAVIIAATGVIVAILTH